MNKNSVLKNFASAFLPANVDFFTFVCQLIFFLPAGSLLWSRLFQKRETVPDPPCIVPLLWSLVYLKLFNLSLSAKFKSIFLRTVFFPHIGMVSIKAGILQVIFYPSFLIDLEKVFGGVSYKVLIPKLEYRQSVSILSSVHSSQISLLAYSIDVADDSCSFPNRSGVPQGTVHTITTLCYSHPHMLSLHHVRMLCYASFWHIIILWLGQRNPCGLSVLPKQSSYVIHFIHVFQKTLPFSSVTHK